MVVSADPSMFGLHNKGRRLTTRSGDSNESEKYKSSIWAPEAANSHLDAIRERRLI